MPWTFQRQSCVIEHVAQETLGDGIFADILSDFQTVQDDLASKSAVNGHIEPGIVAQACANCAANRLVGGVYAFEANSAMWDDVSIDGPIHEAAGRQLIENRMPPGPIIPVIEAADQIESDGYPIFLEGKRLKLCNEWIVELRRAKFFATYYRADYSQPVLMRPAQEFEHQQPLAIGKVNS